MRIFVLIERIGSIAIALALLLVASFAAIAWREDRRRGHRNDKDGTDNKPGDKPAGG